MVVLTKSEKHPLPKTKTSLLKKDGNRSYRILHCIDSLGCGGSEWQLLHTLHHMDRSRFNCSVCYLQPPGDLEQGISCLRLPVTNLNIQGARDWLRAMQGLMELVNQCHAELIHASTSYSNIYAPLVGAIKHIPVVFTLNRTFDAENQADSYLRQWRLRMFFMLRAWVLKVTKARLIAVSQSVKESAVKHLRLPAERIQVVYRGLVPQDYEPGRFSGEEIQKARQDIGLTDAYPVLINVGRLWSVKGQKYLIQAMPIILKRFPQARLLIAGGGPLKGELEGLRDSLGLKSCVEFLGQRKDIPLLLSMANMYVAASHCEGLSNAIVEAMAAGKPVVAFDIPMTREVLEGGAGVLVGARDPEELAREVVQLAANHERYQSISKRASEIVREKFDIRKNVRQIEAYYEQVISDSAATAKIRS